MGEGNFFNNVNESQPSPSAELLARKEEASAHLNELLGSGVPLAEIVQLLDAEEFLTISTPRRNQAPVYSFDAQAFLQREMERGSFEQLTDSFTKLDQTILPPDQGELITTGSGEGVQEKQQIPRCHNLAAVLTQMEQSYSVVSGTNADNMMRGETYRIFIIPALNKMVLVNDEAGNATFVVFDSTNYEAYYPLTKDELKEQPTVVTLRYPGDMAKWQSQLQVLLEQTAAPAAPEKPAATTEKIPNDQQTKPEQSEHEPPPEGWMTIKGAADTLNRSRIVIKKHAEQHRDEHPEWFKAYLDDNSNRVWEHFHPDLIKLLRAQAQEYEPAPAGWMTFTAIAKKLPRSAVFLTSRAEKYRGSHPEWFHKYLNHRNQPGEHIHPDLVALLRKEATPERQGIPSDWLGHNEIAQTVSSASDNTVKVFLDALAAKHPEWQKLDGKKKYYNPIVKKLAEEKFGQRKHAPDGWLTVNKIGVRGEGTIDRGYATIQRVMDQLAKNQPELRKKYKDEGGRMVFHYAPKLIEQAKKIFDTQEPAPVGWETVTGLAQAFGSDNRTINKHVDAYRESHPEWFKVYLNKINSPREHLHPDLIKLLRAQIEK